MSVPNVKMFSQGVPEISRLQERDRRPEGEPGNIRHVEMDITGTKA